MTPIMRVFLFTSIYSITIPVIVLVINLFTKRKKPSIEFIAFSLYLSLAFVTEMVSFSLAVHRINNLWISHFYFPIEFFLLAGMLNSWMENDKKISNYILGIVIVSAILHLFSDYNAINIYAYLIESITLFLLDIYTVYKSDRLEQHFWIAIAITLYFGCTTITVPLKIYGILPAFYIELAINLITNTILGISFIWKRI